MRFFYHPHAGDEQLLVEGEYHNYLFRVRRHREGEQIAVRNMEDGYLYTYQITSVKRREAILQLLEKEQNEVLPKRFLHIFWCIVDPKTIEKSLPTLNELGVSKITFFYCDRSQKNFRLRLEKLRKILINSSQQCGRSRLMDLEIVKDMESIIENDIFVIDFCKKSLTCADNVQKVLIGPEGGFSEAERKRLAHLPKRGLDTPLVLRSESAAIAVAAKVLV